MVRWLGALALCLGAASAWAQDVDTFDVSGGLFDDMGTLQLAHPHLSGQGAFYAGLATSYANDPLIAIDEDGNEISIVPHQLGMRFAFGYTVTDSVRLDLRVPTYPMVDVEGVSQSAIGDIRLGMNAPIVSYGDDGVGFAVLPHLDLPTGSDAALTGGGFDAGLVAAVGGHSSGFGWTTNLGISLGQTKDLGDLALGSDLIIGGGMSYEVAEDFRLGTEVAGHGSLASGLSSFQGFPLEAHLYGNYAMPTGLVASLATGTGLVAGVGAPDYRVVLSLAYHYAGGPPDMDDDGIADDIDACPHDPEDFDQFADEDGCPERDNDEDGFADNQDICPFQAEDPDGYQDDDGCPDMDNDGDGLMDDEDGCPDVPGPAGARGCPDSDGDGLADVDDGCPDIPGPRAQRGCPDRDGDGLFDAVDTCPDTPGPQGAAGCPDRDGDLVADFRDQCPDEPADAAADPQFSDGCPSRVVVTRDMIEIKEKVFFDSGRATIQSRSHGLLDDVAKVLVANPELSKVEVAGHTDSHGSEESNLRLSQSRAEAVVVYLIGQGVDSGRLVPKGYGETKPIDSNETRAGRSNNRRVEFVMLQTPE